ncbi:DUF5107 domain-containing protein [Cohnella endophytica]|uniref:DUF5107 domain-containing protein n=1 Tax=Cohnella endophytica TaxID=2419778 RepID=A0A494X7T1_9BACL|nr:DUF5107 domain-containing protein [Cohnella endophytica]RKP46767.1 DUF5107 domain-containing protein [Cohnella endophytica]
MRVTTSSLTLEGTKPEGENPLPVFRSRNPHREAANNGSLTPELMLHMGENAGERILPYRLQDRYTRHRETIRLKTITLENESLKAVFLPEYGGRLYSLKDKRADREILYKNPVFQPANLAILNAWFSGGIEWNVGHLGHTFTTCSNVHCAKLTDGEGNEFLRISEYERCKNVFWHIDFHLPKGAEQLQVYVRIVNDNDRPVPMYWWTNIAVQETEKARVFSSTGNVIYIDPNFKGYGFDRLPYLPSVPDVDVSYPMGFPYSSEYFFQTPVDYKSPWEAVAYEDGRLFYERSTSRLRYRKMFCWGHHAGGRRWCDFLAKPGEGNYIEVQGGLAPTQLHDIEMPARSVWDFTQLIGMTDVETNPVYQESWDDANEYVGRRIGELLSEDEVYAIHERLQSYADDYPSDSLHDGSGWGALEKMRREQTEGRTVPDGFEFAERTLGAAQKPWIALLREGRMPDHGVEEVPASWMIQEEWKELVEASVRSADSGEGSTEQSLSWIALMHAGVMDFEQGKEASAIESWEKSIRVQPSAWVFRHLAEAMRLRGNTDEALVYMERAYGVSNGYPDRAFAEEHLNLIIQAKQFERAWNLYESLPEEFAESDRIRIIIGAVALEMNNDEFLEKLFGTEFAVIREGETLIIELWYAYNAKKLARARNVEFTPKLLEEAIEKFPPPASLDFRMIGA